MLNLTIDSDNIEYSFDQIVMQLFNAYINMRCSAIFLL
jgi:hypothetical protein